MSSDQRNIFNITSVSYGRTINTGNYSSEKYDISADVEPNICPGAALVGIKAVIACRAGDNSLFVSYLQHARELQDMYPCPPGWLAISGDTFVEHIREAAGIV